ncbi:PQQ-dependent sugar dehydrogenase [Micromonospora sp. M12]
MAFDSQGNLYLATGDNTNPFESSAYSPLDERAGRQDYDSQRTSANTNDLRGKVIRIHPEDDGTYTVPTGNLFAAGTEKTRPEIFAMGFRNPFRIGTDPKTDTLYVGDYGPDANADNPNRARGAWSSGTSSRRATTAGRTARARTRRTTTTRSRPVRAVRSSTAPRR